jgi:ribulose 1,5-bisphosphate carboxylase large subunit-like protein
MAGVKVSEYAEEHEELKTALNKGQIVNAQLVVSKK